MKNAVCNPVLLFLILGGIWTLSLTKAQALNDPKPVLIGTTYYGGHYDETKRTWVIDNDYQCKKVNSGEIRLADLNAVMDTVCDDDSGTGFIDDTPLHNRVSFAELSNDPAKSDYSALGNLPIGTKLEISYQGKCLVAEKLDVGTGGSSVNGYKRGLDLWWQTARALDFKNGFDTMSIKQVAPETALTPNGQSYDCIQTPANIDAVSYAESDTKSNKKTVLFVAALTAIFFSVLAFLGLLRTIKKNRH